MGHPIIEELRQMAEWKVFSEQHKYYAQVAEDARAVKCGAILAQQGVTLAECVVLGYMFPDNAHVAGFHYDLMGVHIPTLIFDGMGDTAIVIIKRDTWDPETPGIIDILAEKAGGKEYKPNLI